MAIAPPLGQAAPALRQTLRRASGRVRARRAVRYGTIGLLAGAVVTVAGLVALRVGWLEDGALADALWLLPTLCGTALGALWGVSRPVSPLALARLTEQKLDLQERLSTALSLSHRGDKADAWTARQLADAEAHASALDLRAALPLTPLPRTAWAALGLCAVAAGLWFAPNLPVFQSPEQRAERAAVKKEGERLVRVARALERDAGAKKLDQTHKAAVRLAELGKQMQSGRLPRRKALMKAAKLTAEMRAQQQALASSASLPGGDKSLARAGKELEKALENAENAPKNAATNGANLTPPVGAGGTPNPKNAATSAAAPQKAMEQARQAMANNDAPSLAEQLSKIAEAASKGEPGDAAGREKLAKQVGALGKALEGTSLQPAAPTLKKAADALQRGDNAEAAKHLREAAKKINEAQSKSADAKALQEMANALRGKGDQSGENGEASEGTQLADASTGEGAADAFSPEGLKKQGHVHTNECLQPGGT
jgi:tetratricopeptide (TPR) repeat protein